MWVTFKETTALPAFHLFKADSVLEVNLSHLASAFFVWGWGGTLVNACLEIVRTARVDSCTRHRSQVHFLVGLFACSSVLTREGLNLNNR